MPMRVQKRNPSELFEVSVSGSRSMSLSISEVADRLLSCRGRRNRNFQTLQFSVDYFGESIEWLGPIRVMAIDEESRRAGNSQRARFCHVVRHALPGRRTLKVAVELRYIQTKFLRVLIHILRFKLALILKQLVVHRPTL